jgi:hypothetical protein
MLLGNLLLTHQVDFDVGTVTGRRALVAATPLIQTRRRIESSAVRALLGEPLVVAGRAVASSSSSSAAESHSFRERGLSLAQNMQAGPCVRVGIQLQRAEVGPTSGPTWRLAHLLRPAARGPPAPTADFFFKFYLFLVVLTLGRLLLRAP